MSTTDPQSELDNITNKLRFFQPSPSIDVEQLAIDIWTKYHLELGRAPTWVELRSRLIAAFRKAKVRRTQQIPFDLPQPQESGHEKNFHSQSTITELMKRTNLTPTEKIIIHDVYYAGRSVAEASKFRSWPQTRVRLIHESAIAKLKRAGQRLSTKEPSH